MATKSPVCFQAAPSIVTGPLIGGSADAGLITWGGRPSGAILMWKRPGEALLRSMAQRSEPSPSSAVRVTRSTSGVGEVGEAGWAPAGVESASRVKGATTLLMRYARTLSSRVFWLLRRIFADDAGGERERAPARACGQGMWRVRFGASPVRNDRRALDGDRISDVRRAVGVRHASRNG